MNIIRVFERERKKMKERGWDKIYVLVDLHGTVFEASYNRDTEPYKWYLWAKEALKMMSDTPWVNLILWSSSWPDAIGEYLKEMRQYGIKFDQVGTNTEEKSNNLSCFEDKTYFNVGLDDKFGFDPLYDWGDILAWFQMHARDDNTA